MGISIAGGILNLGPQLDFSVGYTVGPLMGSAGMFFGGSVGLSDGAALSMDLMSPSISASGWTPQFSSMPPSFDTGLVVEPFVGATLTFMNCK